MPCRKIAEACLPAIAEHYAEAGGKASAIQLQLALFMKIEQSNLPAIASLQA